MLLTYNNFVSQTAPYTLVSGPDGPLTRRYAPAAGNLAGTTPTAHRGIFIADRPHGLTGPEGDWRYSDDRTDLRRASAVLHLCYM